MSKGWKDLSVGNIITNAGNAREYKTGDWRSQRPEWCKDKCIQCGACYMYCPEAAISMNAEGFPEIDYYYCKGCGICARECWTSCFKMIPEDEAKAKDKAKSKK